MSHFVLNLLSYQPRVTVTLYFVYKCKVKLSLIHSTRVKSLVRLDPDPEAI